MIVRKIDTHKQRDIKQFIQFPFELYHDDPLWVPPLRADIRFTLDRQHYPFYQHSEADFFVAERDGLTVGRIAAINNRHYNEHNKKRTAFFYYFDAVNDQDVAENLFEAVSTWARERDLLQIFGPQGMLQIDGNGMLVEGFEFSPAMGIAYPVDQKFVTNRVRAPKC